MTAPERHGLPERVGDALGVLLTVGVVGAVVAVGGSAVVGLCARLLGG